MSQKAYILPNDRARCHDIECSRRRDCLRFIQREIAHDPERVVAQSTFRESSKQYCSAQIEPLNGDAGYEPTDIRKLP